MWKHLNSEYGTKFGCHVIYINTEIIEFENSIVKMLAHSGISSDLTVDVFLYSKSRNTFLVVLIAQVYVFPR